MGQRWQGIRNAGETKWPVHLNERSAALAKRSSKTATPSPATERGSFLEKIMGLDVTAYKKLSKLDALFDSDGDPVNPITREPFENYFSVKPILKRPDTNQGVGALFSSVARSVLGRR